MVLVTSVTPEIPAVARSAASISKAGGGVWVEPGVSCPPPQAMGSSKAASNMVKVRSAFKGSQPLTDMEVIFRSCSSMRSTLYPQRQIHHYITLRPRFRVVQLLQGPWPCAERASPLASGRLKTFFEFLRRSVAWTQADWYFKPSLGNSDPHVPREAEAGTINLI